MKLPCLLALALLPLPAAAAPTYAAPVHISLKASAAAAPNADGFVTLGSVAAITGGDKAARARFAAVLVARAPLPGETRQLTRGDLALKLRQAGINPDTQAILEGADHADVTADCPPAPTTIDFGGSQSTKGQAAAAASAMPSAPNPTPLSHSALRVASADGGGAGGGGILPVIIHSGDIVTILIQSGAMTITAPAVARESGHAGDTIRVHRDGVMTDLMVQVVDSQTVQMDI